MRSKTGLLFILAAPRLELPEHYVDGLVFRQDDIIRLKIPLVAKPAPRASYQLTTRAVVKNIFLIGRLVLRERANYLWQRAANLHE